MYRTFYSLTRKPFEMSPDPYFYYPTTRHNEALAVLNYGVQEKKGLIVISGEVGTGKTLLVRCLLGTLSRRNIAFAFVYNPVPSVSDFLALPLNDLGVPITPNSKVTLLSALNNFLLSRSNHGEATALVVDEAQLLSWELLGRSVCLRISRLHSSNFSNRFGRSARARTKARFAGTATTKAARGNEMSIETARTLRCTWIYASQVGTRGNEFTRGLSFPRGNDPDGASILTGHSAIDQYDL